MTAPMMLSVPFLALNADLLAMRRRSLVPVLLRYHRTLSGRSMMHFQVCACALGLAVKRMGA